MFDLESVMFSFRIRDREDSFSPLEEIGGCYLIDSSSNFHEDLLLDMRL